MGSGVREIWVQIPPPPLSSCVTRGMLVNLSMSVSASSRQGK